MYDPFLEAGFEVVDEPQSDVAQAEDPFEAAGFIPVNTPTKIKTLPKKDERSFEDSARDRYTNPEDQQIAREEKEKINPVSRALAAAIEGVGSGARDVSSLAQRPLGTADDANRIGQDIEQGQAQDAVSRNVRGITRSLTSALPAARLGGAGGLIGFQGASEANQSLTRGADAGLEGSDLYKYAAARGLNEAAVTAAFSFGGRILSSVPGLKRLIPKAGTGGFESIVTEGLKTPAGKSAVAELAKTYGAELAEELVILGIGEAIDQNYGTAPKDETREDFLSRMGQSALDTGIQTAGMVGGVQAINSAAQALDKSAELSDPAPTQQFDGYAVKDGMLVPEGEQNAPPVQSTPQPVVGDNPEPQADAQERPETKPEQVAKPMTWDELLAKRERAQAFIEGNPNRKKATAVAQQSIEEIDTELARRQQALQSFPDEKIDQMLSETPDGSPTQQRLLGEKQRREQAVQESAPAGRMGKIEQIANTEGHPLQQKAQQELEKVQGKRLFQKPEVTNPAMSDNEKVSQQVQQFTEDEHKHLSLKAGSMLSPDSQEALADLVLTVAGKPTKEIKLAIVKSGLSDNIAASDLVFLAESISQGNGEIAERTLRESANRQREKAASKKQKSRSEEIQDEIALIQEAISSAENLPIKETTTVEDFATGDMVVVRRSERSIQKSKDDRSRFVASKKEQLKALRSQLQQLEAEQPAREPKAKPTEQIDTVSNPGVVNTYTTAKGSVYSVHEDGTTTRDKAQRPEHGSDQGVKERSSATFYVDDDGLNRLGEFQAKGMAKKGVVYDKESGMAGIRYRDGKDAGKIEQRTYGKVFNEPQVGLYPVEVWADGAVHFGNKITSVGSPDKSSVILTGDLSVTVGKKLPKGSSVGWDGKQGSVWSDDGNTVQVVSPDGRKSKVDRSKVSVLDADSMGLKKGDPVKVPGMQGTFTYESTTTDGQFELTEHDTGRRMASSPYRVTVEQKASGVLESIRQIPGVAERLDSENRSGETIGQHTENVLRNFTNNVAPDDLKSITSAVDALKVMPVVIALHDIGKADAIKAGDKSRQHEFTIPLVQKLSRDAGFNEAEMNVAVELIGNDAIGEMLKGKISPQKAAASIAESAGRANIPVEEFFKLQTLMYKSDAGAYPALQKKLFSKKGDKMFVAKEKFGVLEEIIYGQVQETPWIGNSDKDGREQPIGGSGYRGTSGFVHGTGTEFDSFSVEYDSGRNVAGPGVYLLSTEDSDVAEHYADRAMRKLLALFSDKTRKMLTGLSGEQFTAFIKRANDNAKILAKGNPKESARWSEAAQILQLMQEGKVGKKVLDVAYTPQKIFDMGSHDASGRVITAEEQNEILANLPGTFKNHSPQRAFSFYEALAKKFGKPAVNEAILSAGYDTIHFVHKSGGYNRPYSVFVALSHQKAKIKLAKEGESVPDKMEPDVVAEQPAAKPGFAIKPADRGENKAFANATKQLGQKPQEQPKAKQNPFSADIAAKSVRKDGRASVVNDFEDLPDYEKPPKDVDLIPDGELPEGTEYVVVDKRFNGSSARPFYAFTPDGLVYEYESGFSGISPWRLIGAVKQPTEPAPKKKLFQRSPEEKERTAEPVRTNAESVQRGEYLGKGGVEAKPDRHEFDTVSKPPGTGGEAEKPQLASPFRKQQSTWKKSILQKKFPTKPVSERGQTALPGMSEDAERAESKLAETAVFRKYRQQIARYDAPLEDGSSWADSVVDQLVSARELIASNRELYDYPSFSDVWEGEMPNHPGRDPHAEDSAQTILVEFVKSEIERLTPDIGDKIKSVMGKPLDENKPIQDLIGRMKSLLDGPRDVVESYQNRIDDTDNAEDAIDETIDGLTDGYRAKGYKEVLKSYIPAIKEAEAAASKRRDEMEAEAGRKEQEEYERLQAEKEVKRKAEAERKAEPASEDADTPLVRGDVVLYGRREARVAIPDLGNLSWKKGNLRIEMTNGPDKGKLVEVERQDVRKLPYEETEAGKAKAESDRKAAEKKEHDRKVTEGLIEEIIPVVRKARKAGVDLAPKTKKATKELISNISLATNISNESLIKEAIDRVLAEKPVDPPEKQRLAAALGKDWADHYGDAFLEFHGKFTTLPENQKEQEYRGNKSRREFQSDEGAAVTYAGRMTGLTEDGMRLALRAMKGGESVEAEASPQPQSFDRQTPRKGTPEREAIDKKHSDTRKAEDELAEESSRLRSELRKVKSGTKKEAQLQKKYDDVQEKLRTAVDRENEKTRRIAMHEDAVDEAKDEWLRYIAIDRLNSLYSELGINRRIPSEGSYNKLKDAAEKEARRLGADKDRAEKLGFDTAQEMFAFGRDTMKDTVAKRAMIDGEEKVYRDAIKELWATDVSGKSDIERKLDNYRRDPDKINEIMQGVRREVAEAKKAKEKAKEMADAMISDAVKERSARAYPLSEVKATVANVLPENILPVGADYISDGRFAIKKSAINPKKAKAMLGRTANEGASVEVANKQFADFFEDKPQGDFEFVGVVDREIIYKKKEITIPAAIYVDENGDVKFVDARFVKYLEGDYDQVAKADNNRILFLKDGKPIAVMQGIDAENSINVAIAKKAVADKTPAEPAPKKRIGRKKKGGDRPGVAKMVSAPKTPEAPTVNSGLNPNYRGPKDTEPGVSFQQLKATWTRIFGTPIRLSYFNDKANAVYKYFYGEGKNVDVARLSNDVASSAAFAAHEIAHGIDKKYGITEGNKLTDDITNELAGWDHSKENKPEEGVAEYMRFRLLHPDGEVEARFPQFHSWFENWLGKHPDLRKKLDEGRKYGRMYAEQPEYQRFAAAIGNAGDDLSPAERWKKKALNAVSETDRLLFDKDRPWAELTKFLKAQGGDFTKDLTPEEVQRNYSGTAGHRSEDAFINGPESIMSNKRFGPGLVEIKELVNTEGELQEAYQYSWARHVLFIAEVDPNWNGGMTVEQAQKIMDATKAEAGDRYEKFAVKLSEYAFNLSRVEVDAGMKTQAEFDFEFKKYGNGKYYLPMERQHPDAKGGNGAGRGLVNIGPSSRRRGSGADLPPKDFLEQLYIKTYRTYDTTMRWSTREHLIKVVDPLRNPKAIEGGGWIMERIDPKSEKSQVAIEKFVDQMVDQGHITEDVADDIKTANKIVTGGKVSQAAINRFASRHGVDVENDVELKEAAKAVPGTVDIWTQNLSGDPSRAIIAHRSNGETHLYQVDRLFYDLAMNAPLEISTPFTTVVGMMGTVSSRLTTSWNFDFLLANLPLDWFDSNPKHAKGFAVIKSMQMLAAYAVYKAGNTESAWVGTKSIKSFTDMLRKTIRGKDAESQRALLDLLDSSGGKLFSAYSGKDAKNRVRRKLGIKAETWSEQGRRIYDATLEGVSSFEELSGITDAPVRLAEGEAIAKKLGFYAKGDKWYSTENDQEVTLPEYAKVRILNAMAEATTNFKKRGAGISQIRWAMPLIGAQLAGLRKQIEYVHNIKNIGNGTDEDYQARATLIKYAGFIAMAAAVAFSRKDDDDWKESESKYDNFEFYGDKGKVLVSLPMPRGVGGFLAGMTTSIIESIYGKPRRTPGEVAVSEVAEQVPTGGGIVKATLESLTNYSVYRNRKIVNDYMGQRSPQAQFDKSTLEPSIRVSEWIAETSVGKLLRISPIAFQYWMDQSLGGQYVKWGSYVERKLGVREADLSRDWGLRRFFPNRHQQGSLNDFYEELGGVREELKGQTARFNAGRIKKIDDSVVHRSEYLSLYEDLISDMRKEPQAIKDRIAQEMKNATPVERNAAVQKAINELGDPVGYMVGLARDALGYPELKDNKNPFYDKDAPAPVKAIIKKFMDKKVESVMLAHDIPTKALPGDASWEESYKKWEAGYEADMKWIQDHKDSPYIAQAIADTKRKPSFRDRLQGSDRPNRKATESPADYKIRYERWKKKLDVVRSWAN